MQWLMLFLLGLALHAQADTGTPSLSLTLLQVFGALAIVLACIFTTAWVAKKLKFAAPGYHPKLKAMASLSLGRKEKVVLLQVEGKTFLLGVASGSINLLHTFTPADDVGGKHDAASNSDVPVPSAEVNNEHSEKTRDFAQFLNKLLTSNR